MSTSAKEYIKKYGIENIDVAALAYFAALDKVSEVAPEVSKQIVQELIDQRSNLKLIASENYSSLAVQLSMGNLLTDKYSEGYPYHRFYPGCENIDIIEDLAREEACRLFKCDHAYVQPHSGSDANLIAYWAILRTRIQVPELEKIGISNLTDLSQEKWSLLRSKMVNQRFLGMDLYAGGHLSHGYRHNISAQLFETYTYGVNPETGLLDYNELNKLLRDIRPLIFLVGYSAYPRLINFARLREMADQVGAVLLVDMAHFAGLVAGGVFENEYNPIPYAHIVTTTTHKTLRGPRSGLILCSKEFADSVDKGCPMVMGGPLPHVIASKLVAFKEANTPSFCEYAHNIVNNAKILAEACLGKGMSIVTGGTDNHLFLIDVRPFGLTGRQADTVLRSCKITLNRNTIPYDTNGPWYTSGLRIGTPAVTSLGMGKDEMQLIASLIYKVLISTKPATIFEGDKGKKSKSKVILPEKVRGEVCEKIDDLLAAFPLYPELDLGLMQEYFGG